MISSLTLENFRNYTHRTFVFEKGTTVITGNNGIGKTNILEAIYALATGKPFRSSEKEVFLQHHAPYGRISGITSQNSQNTENLALFWQVSPNAKSVYFWNEIPISAGEYLKKKYFFAVLFSPEEMNLPFFAPKYRRNFLNRLLSTLSSEYFEAISKYNITLQHRNQLLRRASEEMVSPPEFLFWDEELIKWEAVISKKRKEFFLFSEDKISIAYNNITATESSVSLHFQASGDAHIPFKEALSAHFAHDKMRGSTSIGPHRDDFQILLRGLPLEEVASRGETRSALLSLKSVERAFIQHHTGNPPILLLDDVFSELDTEHREHLLHSFDNTQTIITTTDTLFLNETKDYCSFLKL